MADNVTISQSKYRFYMESNIPFRGYVEGLGYVDYMNKNYYVIPSGGFINNGQQVGLTPAIGFIPTVDSNPGNVIRSYGNSLISKLSERLVTGSGGNIDVNLGDNRHMRLSAKNKSKIECKIEDFYHDNAVFILRVKYLDEKGKVSWEEVKCPLNYLWSFFSDVNFNDLYIRYVEDPAVNRLLASSLDVTKYNRNTSNFDLISFGTGGTSLAVSALESNYSKKFNGLVEDFRASDRARIYSSKQPMIEARFRAESKAFIESNLEYFVNDGKKIKNWSPKYPQRGLTDVMKNRYNIAIENANTAAFRRSVYEASIQSYGETVSIHENLKSGKDPRTSVQYRNKNILKWGNRGLGGIAAVYSLYSLGDYISNKDYLEYEGESARFWTNPRSYRLMGDLVFSIVGFIPGLGMVSAIYFGATTLWDITTYNPGGMESPWQDDLTTGMRQDNTRVNLDNKIIECNMISRQIERDMIDRRTPMIINGQNMNMSRYQWRMLQKRNLK